MSMYLARTTRTLNSNLNPYPRIIAASALRSYPARQVQNQRTLWNFSWFTGGGNTSSSSSASVKKDESESSGGSGGGKVEVEMNATRGTKRESDAPTKGTMKIPNTGGGGGSDSNPAASVTTTSALASGPSTTPVSSPNAPTTTPSTSNSPNSESTTPQQTSREEKEKLAIQALLDRDGGSLGFEFEDGQPEGGARKGVKREMFRVI